MSIFDKLKQLNLGPFWLRVVYVLLLATIFLLVVSKGCSKSKQNTSTFIIGRSSTWPALDLMGKEPNLLAFLDELTLEIAQNEKIAVKVSTTTGVDLLAALEEGKFDGIFLVVTPDPLMHEQFNLSNPIFIAGPVLIVPISSEAVSLKTLKEKGIGIKSGSQFLFRLNQSLDLTFVPYDSMFTALEDLVKGNLAGVVMEAQIARSYIQGFYKDKVKIVGLPLTDVSIRLITRWDARGETLIDHFNKGLKMAHQDGSYDRLIQKWTLRP